MIVELCGIYRDTELPPTDGVEAERPLTARIAVRLENRRGERYASFIVDYEMIPGAQIGDEFTLHLERIKK